MIPQPTFIGLDLAAPDSERHVVTIGQPGARPVATLYCGDAYVIRPTLGFMDADIFDPPYLIKASGAGHYRKKRPGMDQIMQSGLHRGFDLSIIDPARCGAAVIFASNDQLHGLLTHVHQAFHRHALCVWQKTNPQPVANKHYRPDCEFYVHAWRHGYHPQGAANDKLRVSRITSPRGPARHGHPTTKPDALMAKIVANVAGDTICDPFMGTGSTGVAAIRAGRRFVGIEKDPTHFATAVARLTAAIEEKHHAN